MIYQGSCHCGNITFNVEGELAGAMSCNCSICSRKGTLLWFVDKDKFTLSPPRIPITTYTFNKHVIKHQFCSVCGVQAFGEGVNGDGKAMIAVNIRCIEGIDSLAIPTHHHNGKAD